MASQLLLFSRGPRSPLPCLPERPLWAAAIVRCARQGRRVRVVVDPPQLAAGHRVAFPREGRIDGARFCVEALRLCQRRQEAPYYRASGRIARLEEPAR